MDKFIVSVSPPDYCCGKSTTYPVYFIYPPDIQSLGQVRPRSSLRLSVFEIFRQVSIIIFMRTNHYQLEIITDESIRKKILCGVYLEFVDKDSSKSTLFLLSYRGVLNDLENLIVKNPFVLLSKSSYLFPMVPLHEVLLFHPQ